MSNDVTFETALRLLKVGKDLDNTLLGGFNRDLVMYWCEIRISESETQQEADRKTKKFNDVTHAGLKPPVID